MAKNKVVKKVAKKRPKNSKSPKKSAKRVSKNLVVASKVKGYSNNLAASAHGIAGLSARTSRRKPKRIEVPKLPAFIQQRLDELIDDSKQRKLSRAEQSSLDEMVDYVDDRTAYELEKLVRVQVP